MIFRLVLIAFMAWLIVGCDGDGNKDNKKNTAKDTIPPVVKLNGDKYIKIAKGEVYKELGATAIDDKDREVEVKIKGYVDTNLSQLYTIYYIAKDKAGNIASAKREVEVYTKVKPIDNFEIIDTNNSEELTIKGSVVSEDGETGRVGSLTDVVAVKKVIVQDADGNEKEEDQIVYRSFDRGKWSGKLNEETTLLARVFIDPILMNLSAKEQEEIANKLVKEDEFKNALKTQKMYLQAPKVFEYIYNDAINSLTQKALSYLSDKSKQEASKRYLKKIGINQRISNTDIDNIGGSLRVSYSRATNTFTFRNYHNIFLGLRAYEENKNYGFLTTLQDNIINPVSGGAIGSAISKIQEWLNLDFVGTPAHSVFYGKVFDSNLFVTETKAKSNQDKLYEIYKYQGVTDVTTLLNTLRISEAILGGLGDYTTKIKKISQEAKDFTSKALEGIENGLALMESLSVVGEYINFIEEDSSYTLEKDIKNIRISLERIINILKPYLKEEGKYDDWIKKEDEKIYFSENILGFFVRNYNFYPKNKDLKSAIDSISDKKLKMKIYIVGFLQKLYYETFISSEERLKRTYLEGYNYYNIYELHYIVPLWLFLPNEKARKVLKKYKYGAGAKVGTVAIPEYFKLLTGISSTTKNKRVSFKEWTIDFIKKSSKGAIKELKELKKFVDLIKNTTRRIANNTDDLFSTTTLKIIFNFLKDSKIISINSDVIATKIAKRVTPGLAQAKAVLGANEALSWTIGTFIIPNKSYFKVKTDSNGNIKLEYPPFSILGLLSDDIQEKKNWIGNKIYRKDGSDNFLVVTGSYYQPIFNIYYTSQDKYSLINAKYPNNTLVNLKYNIRKSTNDSKSNFYDDLGNKNNTNFEKISPSSVEGLIKDGDYGYYFDLYQAWMKEQGTNYLIKNKTRGIYKEWLEANFNFPTNYSGQEIPTQSNVRYIYKVATGEEISKNLVLKRVNDILYVTNNNDFPVCMSIYFEKNDNWSPNDSWYYSGDYCFNAKTTDYGDMSSYKDGNEYNDLKFVFFDKIVEDYLEEEGYKPPRYFKWFKESKGLEDLTYEVEWDDIGNGELFRLIDTNIKPYKEFYPDENIILKFEEELAIDEEQQSDFLVSSSNIEQNIFFNNKKTNEIKRIYNLDWHFKVIKCKKGEGRGRYCDYDYKTLEISVLPILDNNDYELVIEKALKSKTGKTINKLYVYDIKIYHPNNFELEEQNIEKKGNEATINYALFVPYDSRKLTYKITTSSGKNVTESIDIGSASRGGPSQIAIAPCTTNINVNSSRGIYKEGVVNYNHLKVSIINSRDISINETINIEICDDYNHCENLSYSIYLDKDPQASECTQEAN